jgi:methylmalonyl-CoA mutase cobalamin-binding subunit
MHRLVELPANLPDGRELVKAGIALGESVRVGRSLLSETYGVRSEVAYRHKMVDQGRLMTCMNIGLATWDETARALESIHAESERRGFRIDRYQLNLDRRMGLPRALWDRVPKETGPMLETDAHWRATAHIVPIQPHLGDMMIGSPMSVDNALRAIEAGVTYIGNLSQFAWKYPLWEGDDVAQVAETVKALGVMASKVGDDVTLHSYLDDGFPAQFRDYCSYIGWSMFEHYVIDEVVGARVAIAYGGLTHDPFTKAAMILALESIRPAATCNPFYHGNTTAYSRESVQNYGRLSIDMLFVTLAQLRTGAPTPMLPIPVTEAVRIPSWEEIIEAHTIARRVAAEAPQLMRAIDWVAIETFSEDLIEKGRQFYENLMQGLEEGGVDMGDAVQLLLAIRRLGGVEIENRFGVGKRPGTPGDAYEPLVPTDTFADFLQQRSRIRTTVARHQVANAKDQRLIVASTDVHEYAMLLVVDALRTLGVEPIVAGTGADPHELAELAAESGARAILISTHNGMALTYARTLRRELERVGVEVTVAMGGTLNEDIDGQASPVDLSNELRQLGVHVCEDVTDILELL